MIPCQQYQPSLLVKMKKVRAYAMFFQKSQGPPLPYFLQTHQPTFLAILLVLFYPHWIVLSFSIPFLTLIAMAFANLSPLLSLSRSPHPHYLQVNLSSPCLPVVVFHLLRQVTRPRAPLSQACGTRVHGYLYVFMGKLRKQVRSGAGRVITVS